MIALDATKAKRPTSNATNMIVPVVLFARNLRPCSRSIILLSVVTNPIRRQSLRPELPNITAGCGTGHQRRFLSGEQPPRLSPRSRRDLFLVIGGALGSWLYIRNSDWDRDVREAKERLLILSSRSRSVRTNGTAPYREDVPLPLRHYLDQVWNRAAPLDPRSNLVSVEQTGKFFASQEWYPFNARLLALAHSDSSNIPPGFVWEANVEILKMPNRILQTFMDGKGAIVTKQAGKIPMIQVEEEEPYILFWLAMTPLMPSVFVYDSPNGGKEKPTILWNSVTDLSSCSGQLLDKGDNRTYHMEFEFSDETKLLKSIKVTSPSLPVPWQVNYYDYRRLGDHTLVPSKIEVGQWTTAGEKLNLHLMITNHNVQQHHQR